MRLQLHGRADSLTTLLRCIELPEAMANRSLTGLQLMLIKIGDHVFRQDRAITFPLAGVAFNGSMVRAILRFQASPLCT